MYIYMYIYMYVHVYTFMYMHVHICVYIYINNHKCTHICLYDWFLACSKDVIKSLFQSKRVFGEQPVHSTGWRRPIGCLKLQVIFRKRATDHKALLRKMIYKDKASYGSSPLCKRLYMYTYSYQHVYTYSYVFLQTCLYMFICIFACVRVCLCVWVCILIYKCLSLVSKKPLMSGLPLSYVPACGCTSREIKMLLKFIGLFCTRAL